MPLSELQSRAFCSFIEQILGLDLSSGPQRRSDWETMVLARMKLRSCSTLESYLQLLVQDREELARLAPVLTIGETYFFREEAQLTALKWELEEQARLWAESGTTATPRPLKLLSLGCASGEEAYSLAILAEEALAPYGINYEMLGIDFNPESVQKAREASYSSWAFRSTRAELKARYFVPTGRTCPHRGPEFRVSPRISRQVRFEQASLFEDFGRFDVVFCRNVLIYFSREKLLDALEHFKRCLLPGGLLFLGHSETARGLVSGLESVERSQAFYYRLGEAPARVASVQLRPPSWPPARGQRLALRRSGLHAPVARRRSSLTPAPRVEPSVPRLPAAELRQLLIEERYRDFLAQLDLCNAEQLLALLAPAAQDSDAGEQVQLKSLLRAFCLLQLGDLAGAKRSAEPWLARAANTPESAYLAGLLAEAEHDQHSAELRYRRCLELDPEFLLARLHLGLLARRASRLSEARMQLRAALALLSVAEDGDPKLLLRGPFSVSSLRELLKAELKGVEP